MIIWVLDSLLGLGLFIKIKSIVFFFTTKSTAVDLLSKLEDIIKFEPCAEDCEFGFFVHGIHNPPNTCGKEIKNSPSIFDFFFILFFTILSKFYLNWKIC